MPEPPQATPAVEDLLSKARSFLSSPQVQFQDDAEKRKFLAEKGLSHTDIDTLLKTQVRPQQFILHLYVFTQL